jgi:transposase-like protein
VIALSCPHCGDTASVIRFGYTDYDTPRCRCKACGKTFTLNPRSRDLSDQKREQIENCLAERMSQRAIARALGVSRDTIRAVRKKSASAS